MIIRELQIEELIVYKEMIIDLLINTYIVNFQLPRDKCETICNEKFDMLEGYISSGSAIIIAAIEEDKLIAFLWLYKHDMFGEARLHVNQIAVSNQFRGKGIGKQLMKEAEEQARQLKIEIIDLFVSEANIEAIKMYNAMGYATERRYIKKNIGEKHNAASH